MHTIRNRIWTGLVFLLLGLGLSSCEKQLSDELCLNELELSDLELMELLILPCKPDSEDVITVIEKICGTESEVDLSLNGYRIGYMRHVNSLMMAPCSPELDTTILGQLSPGTYQLLHTVIDHNHLLSDSILLQDTIAIQVAGWPELR